MCGEKLELIERIQAFLGSPPRVRGKGIFCKVYNNPKRITPACAGKRKTAWKGEGKKQDHPRVCGEKKFACELPFPPVGSPPRVRGKVSGILLCVATYRITPACAGKSLTARQRGTREKDHPRVCGEKCCQPHQTITRDRDGITPACAGKSLLMLWLCPPPWDHPRVCGEKRRDRLDYYVPQGSPPRVRGKERIPRFFVCFLGITPACAGKSCIRPA